VYPVQPATGQAAAQDVGIRTEDTRKYLIRRFIRPKWGPWQLADITTPEVSKWEKGLPAAEKVSPRTAFDARSLLATILGDAAAARPPKIPYNPALRPRNRGKRTGRRLLKAPPRTWATPLEALLVALLGELVIRIGLRRSLGQGGESLGRRLRRRERVQAGVHRTASVAELRGAVDHTRCHPGCPCRGSCDLRDRRDRNACLSGAGGLSFIILQALAVVAARDCIGARAGRNTSAGGSRTAVVA
jgi:hypothetical protein